jgi:alpha/beta superfamily hydrolase
VRVLLPVLLFAAFSAAAQELNTVPGSTQVMIKGADHHYVGREQQLAGAIREFLEQLK